MDVHKQKKKVHVKKNKNAELPKKSPPKKNSTEIPRPGLTFKQIII